MVFSIGKGEQSCPLVGTLEYLDVTLGDRIGGELAAIFNSQRARCGREVRHHGYAYFIWWHPAINKYEDARNLAGHQSWLRRVINERI